MQFVMRVTLRGSNGKETVKSYDLGNFATGTSGGDFDAALNAGSQVRTSLATVSDAVIAGWSMTHYDPTPDNSTPAAADIYEEAALSVHLTGKSTLALTAVPAPKIGIFVGTTGQNRDIVDVNDTAVQDYILQLQQHTVLSDGDSIDAAAGVGGLEKGIRRTVRGRTVKTL